MIGFVNDMVTTPVTAFGIYLLAGLVLFHDMKRKGILGQ
jgi:hypothetical protein